jgi:hypothetical protein
MLGKHPTLRARGVKVEDYDLPGLKTEDGIADIGVAWAAWIIDPGKNALGVLQLKQWWRHTASERAGIEEPNRSWSVP